MKVALKTEDPNSRYDIPKKLENKMSAELDKETKEDLKEVPPPKTLTKQTLEKFPIILKSAEIIFCIVCLACIHLPASKTDLGKKFNFALIYTAFTTYLIIDCVFLASKLLGEKIPFKASFLVATVATLHFVLAGILLVVNKDVFHVFTTQYTDTSDDVKNLGVAAIFFSFVNAVLFATEAVYIFIKKGES